MRARQGLIALTAALGIHAVLAASAFAAAGWTAYVTNSYFLGSTVSPITTATNTAGTAIPVGDTPLGVAITPDGRTAYVASTNAYAVTPIDTATNTAGTPITGLAPRPRGVAITPDGSKVYVTNQDSDQVTVISTATNAVLGTPIHLPSGSGPAYVAITPDGTTAYVTDVGTNKVSRISTATNTVVGTPISVGLNPLGIAITPDGHTVYVTNSGGNRVSPIDTATNMAETPITVGAAPFAIAITPDGKTAYVANEGDGTVSPINTATNTAGSAIPVGAAPQGVGITPDGRTVYAVNQADGTVTPIATATNKAGSTITVGTAPVGIAITPDQTPAAAFSVVPAPTGTASAFNGSASSSPVGSIASYRWDFGDGQTATTTTPLTTHVYGSQGTYAARLTVTNTAGTSTAQVFTGQTVSNHGGRQAMITHSVSVPPATLSSLKVSPKKFSLAGRKVKGKCVKQTNKNRGKKACRRPMKLDISYALNGSGTVMFTIKRKTPGRKVKGTCVKQTKKNAGKKKCKLLKNVKGTITQNGRNGANTFTFKGKIGGHKLKPGTYQLTATPAGGTPRKTTFRIVG